MVQEQLQQVMSNSPRRTRELARQLGKLTEAQAALGWGMILVLAALLGAIYLNQTSKIAATGRHAQELRFQLSELRTQNAELERQIAAGQTLERLQQEAQTLGFSQATAAQVEYLVIPNYPAAGDPQGEPLQPVPAPEALPRPPETMHEALWLALKASFNDFIRGEYSEQ